MTYNEGLSSDGCGEDIFLKEELKGFANGLDMRYGGKEKFWEEENQEFCFRIYLSKWFTGA